MRADEFDKKLNEAMPMGSLQSLGQKLRSQLPTFDPKGAAQAKGKLESGKLANKLATDYNQFLGQIRQEPTPRNLLQFLTKAGYGTKGAVADLKQNVKPVQAVPQPGQAIKERVARRKAPARKKPVTKPSNLSLAPKDLELEPMQPVALRKDVTDVPTTSTTQPQVATPSTQPSPVTKPAQPSIANVKLNPKQINSALMAAAAEYYAGATATTAISQAPVTQPTAQPVARQAGPGLTKSFAAGFQGRGMPSDAGPATTQIDFEDPRSLNTIVRQMNSFVQSGGKLDPRIKQTLQQLIDKA